MNKIYKLTAIAALSLLCSCGTYFNQPFSQKKSRSGEFSLSTQSLVDLPKALDPVEVAVYNFSDQTGQYKAVENGSTFSTAVTQGGTTILIKALEDSGWFIPIERENLGNLSTERQIIRNTKEEYIKNLNPEEPPLPPLLYAGLILEGGIVSYDTNIVTGGVGARYFGLGASAQYRQDRITVYLRAVSTSNGEILKTIYVSKTILSQAIDANLFRFIKFQRLLEIESGITKNEPIQLAVKDAIEKAVRDLILEGIIENYWNSEEGKVVDDQLIADYLKEKEEEESLQLYDRVKQERPHPNHLEISGGLSIANTDYKEKDLAPMARLGYVHNFSPFIGLGVAATYFGLENGNQFSGSFLSGDINLHYDVLAFDNFGPFIYGGGGVFGSLNQESITFDDGAISTSGEIYFKLQYGGGLRYYVTPRIAVKIFAEHNLGFSDEVDLRINGRRNDQHLNFGVGLNYSFSFKKNLQIAN